MALGTINIFVESVQTVRICQIANAQVNWFIRTFSPNGRTIPEQKYIVVKESIINSKKLAVYTKM